MNFNKVNYMKHLFVFLLTMTLSSCSVFLKDEKEIDKILVDVVHEELQQVN